jgi:hypothetical protein
MAANSLSPELRHFIGTYVHSVEQLEVLRLLSENPAKWWTVPEVYRQIQSSEKSVGECLESFQSAGLLDYQPASGYLFSPRKSAETQRIAELVKAYHERRVSVIECIYRKPADAIQDFADAFRLRKEK